MQSESDMLWNLYNKKKMIALELDIPLSKCQGPTQEVKFMGAWWIKGAASISPDILEKTEYEQSPSSTKELWQVLGALHYWYEHTPDFSVIACPLNNLLRKGKSWGWTKQCQDALDLLIKELRLFQQLGPLHPTDLIDIEWGFTEYIVISGKRDEKDQRDHYSLAPTLSMTLK